MSGAEKAFREAFDRLKRGMPERLPPRTIVSQNNVAKEADRDPSALRKSRYPELVREIQGWIADRGPASPARQSHASQRRRNRSLQQKIKDLIAQRDHVASLLVEADAKILDLVMEVERLRASLPPSNVVQMRPANSD